MNTDVFEKRGDYYTSLFEADELFADSRYVFEDIANGETSYNRDVESKLYSYLSRFDVIFKKLVKYGNDLKNEFIESGYTVTRMDVFEENFKYIETTLHKEQNGKEPNAQITYKKNASRSRIFKRSSNKTVIIDMYDPISRRYYWERNEKIYNTLSVKKFFPDKLQLTFDFIYNAFRLVMKLHKFVISCLSFLIIGVPKEKKDTQLSYEVFSGLKSTLAEFDSKLFNRDDFNRLFSKESPTMNSSEIRIFVKKALKTT